MDHNPLRHETGWDVRQRIRRGDWPRPTTGMAPGYVQANLAILPKDLAPDFQRFCALNPKPCPLLASSDPGDPSLPTLGKDIAIRTDIGMYRVWRDGEMVAEVTDISDLWRDDLVAFLMGCSHSFEEALEADGLPLRHMEERKAVPVYYSTVPTVPAGPFHGPLVVSMRPFKPADAQRARGACAYRQAGADRRGPGRCPRRRPADGEGGRVACLLGLRGHAAGRRRGLQAALLHHPFAGLHAGDRPAEFAPGGLLNPAGTRYASRCGARDAARRTPLPF